MPYYNLNDGIGSINKINYDFVIIGAGAVGILTAVKLHEKNKKVLLIESGHFEIDDNKQALNEVINSSKVLTSAVWGRKRAIGGTTLAWGGQSLPFTSLDLSYRDWVENSGWPIKYDELKDYYPKANAFMQVDTLNYDTDVFDKIKITPPEFEKSKFRYHLSKWANEPNFKKIYNNVLENNIDILYNATVKKIFKTNNSVDKVEIVNDTNENFTINVNQLIITTGTIESVRLLLVNELYTQSSFDWLGKGFMEHPCCEIGDVFSKNSYKLQKYFNTHVYNNRKYSIRISLSDQAQIENSLLNCSASVLFKPADDAFNPYAELKAMKEKFKISTFFSLLKSFPQLIQSALALVIDKFYYKIGVVNKLVLMVEQEPLSSSRISLSNEKDQYGVAKATINWEISPLTWKTVCKTAEFLKVELERLGFGTIEIYPKFNTDNQNWINELSDVNHHMGGCRMSNNDTEGVVNTDLKVWGFENLYMCSCAVFPTSSHSNPTLTALALACRLVEFLN